MLLPKERLTVREDGGDSVVDIVLVQDSSGYSCKVTPYQSLPEWPLPPPISVMPLKARIMKFEFPFELGSPKYMLRAARQLCLDLNGARKSVDKRRPVIFIAHSMTGISTMRSFLKAIAEEDVVLPIANFTGLIYTECSRDTLDLTKQQQPVLAASKPTKLDLRPGVSGLSDYFTLTPSGIAEDTCEIEVLSFYGGTGFKVLMDSAEMHSPRFSTGGKDMYRLDNGASAAEYITARIWALARDIVSVLNSQVTTTNIMPIPSYHMDAHSYAMINWLSQSLQTLSPASPKSLVHNEYTSDGRWLLERPEFYTWWHSDNCPIFWLSGSAGSGKSTLTSYVIEKLKRDYFHKAKSSITVGCFCDARYRASAPTAMMLKEIISELLPRQKQDHSRIRLESVLADLDDEDKKMSIGQLRFYFKEIQRTITVGEKLILVFDGLDDIEEPESSLIGELLYLAQNRDANHRIKCFISANSFRPSREIIDRSQRIRLDEAVLARQDLHNFIMSEVEKIFQSSYFAPILYEKLTAQPEGIFCRAVLTLRGLKQIDTSNEAGVCSFINSIPNSLMSAYHEMLYCIPESDRSKAFKLFAFITYTFRPLRISELLDLMDFDLREVYPGHFAKSITLCHLGGFSYTENDILRLSGGLLTITEDQTVQFVHNSVRDFIVAQSSKSRSDSLCMNESQAHEILSRTCLYFLQNRCDESFTDSLGNIEELDDFRSKEHHDFIDYALQYWSNHYKAAEAKSDHLPGLLDYLIQMKSQHHWSKYYGYSSTFAKPATEDYVRAALCIGTKVGSVKLVQMLLEKGTNPDRYVDFNGNNPLHIAAAYGYLPVVELLLKRGACVDMPSGINGRTPLQYAAASGHTLVMNILLQAEMASRSNDARSICEYIPLRTIWVVCHSNHCCFRYEQLPITEHENILTAYDGRYESNLLDWRWAPPLRRSIVAEEGIENALLTVPCQYDRIRKSLARQKSMSKGKDCESPILKFLIQQLLQIGIDSVWQYSKAFEMHLPVLNDVEPVQILMGKHLHLIVDTKAGNAVAQNWCKSLIIAIQRKQEDSMQLLLQNEAVALPKALSLSSSRLKSIKEKDDLDFGFVQAENPNCWTGSAVWNNTF